MSDRKPNRGDKPFTFDLEITIGTTTLREPRTIYATSPELALRIMQITLAVVYGITRAKITAGPREGTR